MAVRMNLRKIQESVVTGSGFWRIIGLIAQSSLACLNEQNGLHSPSYLPMNRTYPVWLTAVGIALARSVAPDASEPPPRPNMVVIVADDLGWANVGYHGSSIPTPRLDDLAAKGRRLEQHYVSPVCSPTRTALMTGRYASRFGVTTPQNDRALPFDTVTIARALNSVGYDTALAGKWHLGSDPNWGPQRFGFDDSYGSLAGGVGPYDHHYKQGPYTRTWHRNGHLLEESGHVTDLIAREATGWLETRGDRPFFLYVPFTAPHIPIKEPPEWLERCRHIADPQERLFAACVAHLDDAIGRILDALERNGQRDQTLVLFFSDNGAPRGARNDDPLYPADGYAAGPCSGQNAPLRGFKAQLYEGGIRVPAILSWPARLKPGKVSAPLHAVDWMPTFCRLAGYQPVSDLQWDGRDVWPVLTGEQKPEPRVLYWAGTGFRSRAVRQGDWKLIVESDKAGNLARQLFDLAQDPSEQKNLAITRADLADRLAQLLEAQAALDNTRLARDPEPPAAATEPDPSGIALVRTIDLELGEEQEVELADGHRARVQLIDLVEERDTLRQAIRAARAPVTVNGIRQVLTSATYHLPVTVAGVQIDCPITRGYADPDIRKDFWALRKAGRFRLWPAGSPWMPPGAFGYPVRQRWFASGTQMANEPTFVDGGEAPGVKSISHRYARPGHYLASVQHINPRGEPATARLWIEVQ